MALSAQDINKGVDLTGVNPVTGADLNNLIDLAVPVVDTAAEGKSLNIWTVDSALDTPIVPDAATTAKWKKYFWLRYPHNTATNTVPQLYAWDDNAVSVATYLKWKRVEADTTDIEADIAAIEVDITNLQLTLNAVTTMAGNAGIIATNANNNATAALATANTANANATQALADAAAAQITANAAKATADTALENANAAQTTANNALANSNATAANKFFANGVEYDIIDGVIIDIAHGLGARPKFVNATAICKAVSAGHAIGDEIDLECFEESNNDTAAFAVSRNATNITIICRSITNIRVASKATPSILTGIDVADWKVKIYAWA